MTQYTVLVQPSGRSFSADSEQTVLAAALQAGLTLPHGCRNGGCGSCKGRVLSGEVEHADHAEAALSAAEAAQGLALFCCAQARSPLVIEVRIAAALDGIVSRRMPARIEHLSRPAPDVALLRLKLPASEQLLYRAGQYLDILLADGSRRSYSIATAPGEEGPLELHIRHMPGGLFTDALFGCSTPAIQERSILRIEAPLGSFHLHEELERPIVLLAGGTGFAPLKAIAEYFFAAGLNRDDPLTGRRARPLVLYWGARTRPDLYLDELPRRWAVEQPNFSYVPVLSEPDAPNEPAWTGRRGLVHEAVMQDLPDLSAHQVYACGVPAMVQAAQRDFVGRCGLPQDCFFSDAFVSLADGAAKKRAWSETRL